MSLHDTYMIHSRRATSYVEIAKSCLKRPRVPGPRNMNLEDSIQFYHHAQTSYRIVQEWEEAADCMKKSAELMWKMGDKHEAMITLSDCADLHERGNVFESVEIYETLISWACDLSRYGDAGRYQKRIAELLEEGRNYEDALEAYRHAAHFFRADVKTQEAHQCMIRYALLSADLEDYDVSLEALVDVARHCLGESNLTKFNARDFFFRAGLILLAQGRTEDLSARLTEWRGLDAGFVGSREYAFMRAMVAARRKEICDDRLHTFADDLYDYDNLAPLSSWALRMLKRFQPFVEEDARGDVQAKAERKRMEKEAEEKRLAEFKVFQLRDPAVAALDDAEEEEMEQEEAGEQEAEGGQEGEEEEEDDEEEEDEDADKEAQGGGGAAKEGDGGGEKEAAAKK